MYKKCKGCRDISAGNQLISRLRAQGVTTGTAEIIPLDLMSLNSVKEFAAQVNAKCDKVNLLINNGVLFIYSI